MKYPFRLMGGLLLVAGSACSTSSASLGSLPAPGAKKTDTRPIRTTLELDGEPTGPSIYDKCRRSEPARNVLRLDCRDDRLIRISVFPEDVRLESLNKSSQAPLQHKYVDVRLGDHVFDAMTYSGDSSASLGEALGRQSGIVIEIRKPPATVIFDCVQTNVQEVASTHDTCLDYFVSMQRANLDTVGTTDESTEVDFAGAPLPLPKGEGCVVEGSAEVRCGSDKLTWEVGKTRQDAQTYRRGHEHNMKERVPTTGARFVSEQVFTCRVRGQASGCRQIVLEVPVEDGPRFLVAYDAVTTVDEKHLFVLCSTWIEEPPEDTPIPAACEALIEVSAE